MAHAYTVVTRYKTTDGRLFETAEEALDHVEDEIMSALGGVVKEAVLNHPTILSMSMVVPVVEQLYKYRDTVYRALLMERNAPAEE